MKRFNLVGDIIKKMKMKDFGRQSQNQAQSDCAHQCLVSLSPTHFKRSFQRDDLTMGRGQYENGGDVRRQVNQKNSNSAFVCHNMRPK